MMLKQNKNLQFLLLILATIFLYLGFCYYPENLKVNDRFIRYALIMIFALFWLVYLYVDINKTLKNLLLTIIFMAGFSFISVPIYNTFCDVTGINGKIDLSVSAATPKGIDMDRTVTVEFVVNHNREMPWDFKPQHVTLKVHPGELKQTGYFAKNKTNKTMIGQAIPSISPNKASKYFKKVECFCFSSQKLGPLEKANLGLAFYLDPDLPKDVKRITLSYTIFDVTNNKDAQNEHAHSHHS